ncbi:VapE domain-containing protein [Spirosoma luteum]|uniref:VapE domain-containing protein n=1 Tax=Spirosoma luteum TaxID=431553 RepID=UPI00036CEB38|nr:VapE domain-containing protein [Spirosoma luteum]
MMTTETKNPMLSLYNGVRDTTGTEISLQEFLDGIVTGKWENEVNAVRALWNDEAKQKALKIQQLNVTIGGTFSTNNNANLQDPSGYMAVDIDELDGELETVRLQVNNDPYTYASFASIRGKGLCVIIKIHPERWDESWEGIKAYYMQKYCRVVDKSTGNISRRRFISFDKETYVNERANLFKLYLKKERKAPKPAGTVIHTKGDIEYVIQQFEQRGIELHDSTRDWVRAGLAFASEYDTGGLDYFQRVSQFRHDYDPVETEKMYRYLCRNKLGKVTISTFYWIAKENGCDIMTPKTRDIARTATMQKRQKIKAEDVIDSLVKVGGVGRDDAEQIVKQVYESAEEIQTDDTLFDQLELFLRQNYPMRRNEISRYIEDEKGRSLIDDDFNTIWVHSVKVLGDRVSDKMVNKLIHSSFTPTYNPIKDFFRDYTYRKPTGLIMSLAETIETDTGVGPGEFFPNYAEVFVRKWLIGIVSAVFGEHCELILTLTGEPGTGKTEWFRRLLPPELGVYFAETTWPITKDTDMLMCENLITFNDEWKGKTVKDPETLKGYASVDRFTLREPYGKSFVKRRRLAVMCGTSNPTRIIADSNNNRKVIPINVLSINYEAYNAIDKIDLFMEAYHAYMGGERHHLTKDEIKRFNESTSSFDDASIERQIIDEYFALPSGVGGEPVQWISSHEIQTKMEVWANNRKLDNRKIGHELQSAGFKRRQKRGEFGKQLWGYDVIVTSRL